MLINKKPLISIIVPVYNSEKTLCRCIDSILKQTFNDWELLLIDDGSIDQSGNICDQYAAKNQRIKVFHKRNGGVSSARNYGLEKALGEWINFVDADDWIDFNCLECCVDSISEETDLIMFSCKWAADCRLPNMICKKQADFQKILPLFIDKITFVTPWCKLFRRSIIEDKHLRFDLSLSSGEDTLFSMEYLKNVKNMNLLSLEAYHYDISQNSDSLSKKVYDDWNSYAYFLESIFLVIDELEDIFGVKLYKFRCLLCESRINRFLSVFSFYSTKCIIKELNVLSKNKELKFLFLDKTFMVKGERRHLFDWLIKRKCFFLLAIYIKYVRAEY